MEGSESEREENNNDNIAREVGIVFLHENFPLRSRKWMDVKNNIGWRIFRSIIESTLRRTQKATGLTNLDDYVIEKYQNQNHDIAYCIKYKIIDNDSYDHSLASYCLSFQKQILQKELDETTNPTRLFKKKVDFITYQDFLDFIKFYKGQGDIIFEPIKLISFCISTSEITLDKKAKIDLTTITCDQNIISLYDYKTCKMILKEQNYINDIDDIAIEEYKFNEYPEIFPHINPYETSLINKILGIWMEDPNKNRGELILNNEEKVYVKKNGDYLTTKFINGAFDYISGYNTPVFETIKSQITNVKIRDNYYKYQKILEKHYENGIKLFEMLMNPDLAPELEQLYQPSIVALINYYDKKSINGKIIFFHYRKSKVNIDGVETIKSIPIKAFETSSNQFTNYYKFFLYMFHDVIDILKIDEKYAPLFVAMINGLHSQFISGQDFKLNYWLEGPAGGGKSYIVEQLKKTMVEGTYLEKDEDGSNQSLFGTTQQGGMSYFMEEASGAFANTRKQNSDSANKTRQYKTTMNQSGRISRPVLELLKRKIDLGSEQHEKTDKVTVTYVTKYDSIGVYLSNQSADEMDPALKSRLYVAYIGESYTPYVIQSILEKTSNEIVADPRENIVLTFCKDLQFLTCCYHQLVFMKVIFPVFNLPSLIILLEFFNNFQKCGIKIPHIRTILAIMATIREQVISYSFARVFGFNDHNANQDFKFKMLLDACQYQYVTIEQIITGFTLSIDTLLNPNVEFIKSFVLDKKLKFKNTLKNFIYFQTKQPLNVHALKLGYDNYLVAIQNYITNTTEFKDTLSFRKVYTTTNKNGVLENYLDLNWLTMKFKAKNLYEVSENMKGSDFADIFTTNSIQKALKGLQTEVKLKFKKPYKVIKEDDFLDFVINICRGSYANTNVKQTNKYCEDTGEIYIDHKLPNPFYILEHGENMYPPGCPSEKFDANKFQPAVEIETTIDQSSILIHFNIEFFRMEIKDNIKELIQTSLKPLQIKDKTYYLPSKTGIEPLHVKGNHDKIIIDINKYKKKEKNEFYKIINTLNSVNEDLNINHMHNETLVNQFKNAVDDNGKFIIYDELDEFSRLLHKERIGKMTERDWNAVDVLTTRTTEKMYEDKSDNDIEPRDSTTIEEEIFMDKLCEGEQIEL